MNKVLLVVLGALICAFAADNSSAGVISPSDVSYVYYDWNTYPPYYGRSDAGDDLTNGYLNGVSDELSLDNADWVEFISGGAHIVFDLGTEYDLASVGVGYFLAPGWGLPSPGSMDISFSNDLVTFTTPVNLTGFTATTPWVAQPAVSTFSIAGNSARYVDIFVHPASSGAWFMLGEVQFTAVPEPATMLLLGLGSLAMLRKKTN